MERYSGSHFKPVPHIFLCSSLYMYTYKCAIHGVHSNSLINENNRNVEISAFFEWIHVARHLNKIDRVSKGISFVHM